MKSLVYPTHIFRTSVRENYSLCYSQLIEKLPHSLFLSPSLFHSDPLHFLPSLSLSFNPYTSLSPPHIPPSLSNSHYLPLSHRCSLEGWVASSIYFPLGCRWFCSPPAIHILDHKRRSPSHRAPAPPRCGCHSWEYLDLCKLLQANLKGRHTSDTHINAWMCMQSTRNQ